MKHVSLKFVLLLWFGIFIAALGVLSTVFVLNIGSDAVQLDMKAVLAFDLYNNRGEIEDHADDPENIRLVSSSGVKIAAYRADGTPLSGSLPEYIEMLEFEDRVFRSVSGYYVYDFHVDTAGGVWLRGCCRGNAVLGAADTASGLTGLMIPGVAIIGVAAGFVIFLLSLRQIKKLQREIDEISTGEDLSRRIHMRVSSAELARLSASFNGMVSRLEQSFQAEARFASNASHELRTPTTVILAECEYALEEPHTAEEYCESFTVVQRQADRMSATIGRLLSFTRLEQGTENVQIARMDLAELAQTLTCEYRERQPQVEFWIHAPEPVWVMADLALMTRLIENLLDNACKFGGNRVHMRVEYSGGDAILAIEDDGIGIAPAEQPKIWNHFYQTEPSRTGNLKGSCGIGLALVRQIAQLHGGSVSVASVPGVGSTFTFRMPCARESGQQKLPETKRANQKA